MRLLALTVCVLLACTFEVPVRRTLTGAPAVFRRLPVSWAFRCDFSEADRAPVRRAAAYWNSLVSRPVFAEEPCLDGTGPRFVGVVMAEMPALMSGDTWAETLIGPTGGLPESGGVVFIGPWVRSGEDAFRESIARHELGHVLGYDHSPVPECLMFPKVGRAGAPKRLCYGERSVFLRLYGGK